MSETIEAVLSANQGYAATFGAKADLAMPPARRFAILTCMDARLDPAKYAGLAEGDAHVIRNAGGRASDDAIRSLVISHKLLGTREWLVIHHTDCGMETFTNEVMADLLEGSLETASIDSRGWHNSAPGPGSPEGRYINWLTIRDNAASVVEDVKRIKAHPLVPAGIPVYGYIYDCKSGHAGLTPGKRGRAVSASTRASDLEAITPDDSRADDRPRCKRAAERGLCAGTTRPSTGLPGRDPQHRRPREPPNPA